MDSQRRLDVTYSFVSNYQKIREEVEVDYLIYEKAFELCDVRSSIFHDDVSEFCIQGDQKLVFLFILHRNVVLLVYFVKALNSLFQIGHIWMLFGTFWLIITQN